MKITCDREKLLGTFQMVGSVVPSRSPKPILQNVKFEIADGTSTLMATDLEVGIRAEVPGVEVETPGQALLSVARFGSILRESGDEKLRIEADPNGAVVSGERSEFRLPGADPEEFPAVSRFNETKYYELPARLFREMIRRTVFATDNESTRYALGGVLLEFGGDKLIAVGTDGRRLAKMEGPAKSVGGAEGSDTMLIIPSRTLGLVERSLADNEGDIQIAGRSNDVLIKSQRATIYSRLVEGRFPRWRDVFPRRVDSMRIELAVGPFHSTVRQAAIVTTEDSRGIDFTFGDGKLVLTGRSHQSGQARVELPIAHEGPSISVTLDPRYMIDFLRVLDQGTTISIDIKDAESAVVASTDDGYGYVIMPLSREHA